MTTLRMILNTFYSGPQAWFFLAADNGYFAEAGIEVAFTEGDTLANAVPKVASGAFDIGYGDMNALIEMAGTTPDIAPVAVYIMHNWSPYTIAVAADGPITHPAQLAGRTLLTHANDAALRMFPEFCEGAGLDPASVNIEVAPESHRLLIPHILSGEKAGLFGFVNTIGAAAIEAGVAPASLRHFEWRHFAPDLCGAALIVSRSLIERDPALVERLVTAVNRGLADVIADPEAAVAAVARRNPKIDMKANHARLLGTLAIEMSHPAGATLGIGDVERDRLDRAISLIARVKKLAAVPAQQQVFDRRFLPEAGERITSLASG